VVFQYSNRELFTYLQGTAFVVVKAGFSKLGIKLLAVLLGFHGFILLEKTFGGCSLVGVVRPLLSTFQITNPILSCIGKEG